MGAGTGGVIRIERDRIEIKVERDTGPQDESRPWRSPTVPLDFVWFALTYLDYQCDPDGAYASLSPAEARRLAAALVTLADAIEQEGP